MTKGKMAEIETECKCGELALKAGNEPYFTCYNKWCDITLFDDKSDFIYKDEE